MCCAAMLEAELDIASDLARQAGRILLEVYATDFSVAWKGKADPVTQADRLANVLLVRELRARFAGDGVVAEEDPDHSDAVGRRRCWFVDPLDGTKEFIAKNGEFSVMIGLAIDGRAVLGVVYQPVTDKLYRGVVGAGAVLVQAGSTRELVVSACAQPSALRLVVSRSHRAPSTDEVIARLGIVKQAPSGSVGLKVGLIAEQDADLYVHMSGHSSKWDACAPEAILRAAGGRFTDLLGDDIEYRGLEMANTRGLLACNDAAFGAVLPVVRAVAIEAGLDR
jgi:3'(2'), 5'-bisphosphate nucleotidase